MKNMLKSKLIKYDDLDSMSDYILIEKRKILYIYKIYESFNSNLNDKINFYILKVKDTFLQIIILEVLLLYLLSIFNKDLTYRTLEFILKSKNVNIQIDNRYKTENDNNENPNSNSNSNTPFYIISLELKKLINIEMPYLTGLYFDLYLQLVNRHDFKHSELISKLEMNELFLNVNKLHDENNLTTFNKLETSSLHLRKILINKHLMFIDKELNIFNQFVNITQHVHDYIILKKIDTHLIEFSFYYYQIFLEIRAYFFEFIDKNKEDNKLFTKISDKVYNDFQIIKNNFECFFIYAKEKQSNVLHKDIEKKTKERSDALILDIGALYANEMDKSSSSIILNKIKSIGMIREDENIKAKENNEYYDTTDSKASSSNNNKINKLLSQLSIKNLKNKSKENFEYSNFSSKSPKSHNSSKLIKSINIKDKSSPNIYFTQNTPNNEDDNYDNLEKKIINKSNNKTLGIKLSKSKMFSSKNSYIKEEFKLPVILNYTNKTKIDDLLIFNDKNRILQPKNKNYFNRTKDEDKSVSEMGSALFITPLGRSTSKNKI